MRTLQTSLAASSKMQSDCVATIVQSKGSRARALYVSVVILLLCFRYDTRGVDHGVVRRMSDLLSSNVISLVSSGRLSSWRERSIRWTNGSRHSRLQPQIPPALVAPFKTTFRFVLNRKSTRLNSSH